MKSITLFRIALFSLLLATLIPAHAQNYTKITYVHSDADGTPFAATDSRGNVEWHIDHYPYGKEYSNTQVARKNNISFAGKPYDEEIGLSYFGGRWYDPDIGRFTGIDPMPVNPNDYRSFNRYSYGFNNPYKYVDPDGNLPVLIPIAIFIAKEVAAEAASRATGGATDFLSFRRMGTKAVKKGTGVFVKNSNNQVVASNATKRRTQNANDLTVPSERAARRQAFRDNNVSTSQANNYERVKVYGKNDNLKGSNGQPSEIIRTKDLNGNRVEIQHHSNGHNNFPDGTHELPHYHGKKNNHISYPKKKKR